MCNPGKVLPHLRMSGAVAAALRILAAGVYALSRSGYLYGPWLVFRFHYYRSIVWARYRLTLLHVPEWGIAVARKRRYRKY